MNGKSQSGFTLIEIVVATFIMILGMAMIGSVVTEVSKKNFLSLRHTQAVILAQNRIEILLNYGYNSSQMQDGSYENPLNPVDQTGFASGVFTQFWDIEDLNPIEKSKLITSSVTWLDADGEERRVILTAVGVDESN